ncbi:MAG TPA: CotH kinase family protein [Kofleriaceae bacterium]|nr:CotH kinase family protein [Kofleriaceae bacterium]
MTRVLLPALLLAALAVVGCSEAPGPDDYVGPDAGTDPGVDGGGDHDGGVTPDGDCAPMYSQDLLPEFQLTISQSEWAALEDEFLNHAQRVMSGLDPKPYHPTGFRYVANGQSVDVANVMVRLKGNSSWDQTVAFDTNPKMQFVISFNEIDPGGRFMGVRKVELDMPRTDLTFLKQRLALKAIREMGIPAQCANSARLVINGQYYGLYTNLERFDKELLQRVYGHDDDNGNLWDGGRIIETNEDSFTWDRLDAFWHVTTVDELRQLADLDDSYYEWAAEEMVGDADGYGNGYANFYLYDHPTRGFIWMPHDLDTSFDADFLTADSSPVFAPSPFRWDRDWDHYRLVMADPAEYDKFTAALATVRSKFDPAELQADLDKWQAQIAASAEADPHRPFSMDMSRQYTGYSRQYIADRARTIDTWLSCLRNGGADADGDGYDLCHDCDDHRNNVHQGLIETCDMIDNDCNGKLDDLPMGMVCQ